MIAEPMTRKFVTIDRALVQAEAEQKQLADTLHQLERTETAMGYPLCLYEPTRAEFQDHLAHLRETKPTTPKIEIDDDDIDLGGMC